MELKKYGRDYGFDAPTYDSTKAALDELEDKIRKIDEWSMLHIEKEHGGIGRRLTALEESMPHDEDVCEEHELDRRITALEVRITEAPRILGPLDDELYQRLTALEAKVDAPIHCGLITCTNYEEIIFKQPPDTCGNCARPWQAVTNPDDKLLVCKEYSNGNWGIRYRDEPACPHHERRA